MTSITQMPLKTDPDPELEALKDSAATQRALDYYLKPSVSQQLNDQKVFLLREGVSQEEAMVHASELLRCVIATAQGSSESLQGSHRDLVLGMVYFVELAKTCVDSVVDAQQLPAR
ncbi:MULTISPECIES: DUF6124 family protein [Pseudomonas]|uniref:DUF6124 family protein n=1 Tax=Pseudomonas TaxID=286 RepID=UPI0010406C9D|nr:DUF3077 domain-containing protein [Pseudomonas sp. D1HM]MBW0235006.1 hypothetical protein [Pseudomonas sp. D1HM]